MTTAKKTKSKHKSKSVLKKTKKKSISPVIIITIACILLVGAVVLFSTRENYYSPKYYGDYSWYITTCVESMQDAFEATTAILCDCGYYEFRNIYGSRIIHGALSVADVIGIGTTISNDRLVENIKTCYDSEVNEYKSSHPNVDLDAMWSNGKNVIVPKRMLEASQN